MAWRHPCWAVLGIEPTSDKRAIRIAYTARLKAIDPEADPQAFIALREAFDAAGWEAEWVDRPDDDADEEWDGEETDASELGEHDLSKIEFTVGRQGPYEVPFPHGSDPRRDPGAEPAGDLSGFPEGADPRRAPWNAGAAKIDAHATALARMLQAHDDGETYATAEQKAELLEHWAAITADPRMQEIAFFADADRWFSEMIARAIPFSDPLIMPATRFFGWTRSDGTITQSWAAGKITQRYAAIDFMTAVARRDHPLHKAWLELIRPADERSRRGRVNERDVVRLLTLVRTRYPDLEGAFHFYRVGLWDGSVHRSTGWRPRLSGWGIGFAIIVLALVRIIASAPTSNEIAFQAVTLEDARTDIDSALSHYFDGQLKLVEIDAANPQLSVALAQTWQKDKQANAIVETFRDHVRVVLNTWLAAGIESAPPDLLLDLMRANLDVARQLQARDPGECRAFLQGKKSQWDDLVSQDVHKRLMAIWVRALLTAKGDVSTPDKKGVSIPGEVTRAAAKRSGLTLEQFRKTLRFEGDDAAICKGRIGLMETVLDLPEAQRLPFMRVL